MFHFLGILVFLILAVILIVFVVLGKIVQTFLGLGRGNRRNPYTYYQTRQPQDSTAEETTTRTSSAESTKNKKKIFDQDEGEYVDFEEVK